MLLAVFLGFFSCCVSSCDPQPGPGLIHAEPCVAGPWPSVWKVSPGPPSSQLVSTSSSRVKMTTTRMWPKSSGSLETVRAVTGVLRPQAGVVTTALSLRCRDGEAEEGGGSVVRPRVRSAAEQAEAAGPRATPTGDLLLRGARLR